MANPTMLFAYIFGCSIYKLGDAPSNVSNNDASAFLAACAAWNFRNRSCGSSTEIRFFYGDSKAHCSLAPPVCSSKLIVAPSDVDAPCTHNGSVVPKAPVEI